MNSKENISTIFVDCFNTIIFRNIKRKEVFKQWANELATKLNIKWQIIYKTYNNVNFNLSFKKLFSTLTLQEEFSNVLKKVYLKLSKKYTLLNQEEFISLAKQLYIQKELDCFCVNNELISFIRTQKEKGKKIYLVSDFYCKSEVFTYWFKQLNILDVFEKLFSSADFNKEKATTKIYKHLLNHLQLNPKNVVMYGDNFWSDILMSKACGLNAKRVKITKEKLCKKQKN